MKANYSFSVGPNTCRTQAAAAGLWFVSGRVQCTAVSYNQHHCISRNKICCSSCLIRPRGKISTSESQLVSVGVHVSGRMQSNTSTGLFCRKCLTLFVGPWLEISPSFFFSTNRNFSRPLHTCKHQLKDSPR